MGSMDGSKRVLVAVDGSPCSLYAVSWYLQNLYKATHHVIFAHIAAPFVYSGRVGAGIPVTQYDVKSHTEKVEKRFSLTKYNVNQIISDCKKYAPGGLSHEYIKEVGAAGEQLCAIADQRKVHMIVMGTRGLGTIRRTILGSVSSYVVHHAHCPVIICRQD